jgi:aryl-alcohol dehydrogenase-like predicted oxidoreductase
MTTRTLGQSDIVISPMIYGAWGIGGWLWGGQEHDDAIDAIRTSLDEGITAIDTAPVYGFGRSEQLVAEALQGRSREDVVLLTKFGLRWDIDGAALGADKRFDTEDLDGNPLTVWRYAHPDSVIEECERSLRRLKTDYIDVLQIHWPDPITPIAESFGAVARLIEQGKVRAAGVSNYSAEQMAEVTAVCPLSTSQPPYSMVLRDIEADVLPWCAEHNVAVIPYSPLQRGLLTGKYSSDHQFPATDHRRENPFFRPGNIKRVNALLDEISPIAEAHDATLPQLVIAWTIARQGITAPIVGARNAAQACDNAAAMNLELTDGEIRQINQALDRVELER